MKVSIEERVVKCIRPPAALPLGKELPVYIDERDVGWILQSNWMFRRKKISRFHREKDVPSSGK